MSDTSRTPGQKTWQGGRRRVSVLAEMALRREKVTERLVELRERNSLTQEQAAQRVGVNLRQWQRWEAGESMPYPRNLDAIASKFGISVEEFFDPDPLPRDTQLDRIEQELRIIRLLLERLLPDETLGDVLDDLEQDPVHPEQQRAGGGGRPQRAA